MPKEKNKGYITLSRKLISDEMWTAEPFTKAQAWVDLIFLAGFKDNDVWIGDRLYKLKRGQLAWSLTSLAERWDWSRNKVRRYISILHKSQNVIQRSDHRTTVITICNYNKYQLGETTDDTTGETTDDTTDDTQTKKDKGRTKEGVKKEKYNAPDKIKMDDALREYINKYLPGRNPDEYLSSFKLQCEAKGYKYKNYRSALMNWVRKEAEQNPNLSRRDLHNEVYEDPRDRPAGFF